MRIIIAGGRDFSDFNKLDKETIRIVKTLNSEGYETKREFVEIISGTAKGADKLGEKFAQKYNLKVIKFPANWSLGKKAGFIRNGNMAKHAKQDEELGVLVAFWDGKSKGTGHMIDLAKKHELRVFIINY